MPLTHRGTESSSSAGTSARHPATVAAALVVLGVVLVVVLVVVVSRESPTVVEGGPSPTSTQSAKTMLSRAQAKPVHEALHDIAALCRPGAMAEARQRVAQDVRVILSFARRYPEAAFPIDDETGTALSLLLVTRQSLATST